MKIGAEHLFRIYDNLKLMYVINYEKTIVYR